VPWQKKTATRRGRFVAPGATYKLRRPAGQFADLGLTKAEGEALLRRYIDNLPRRRRARRVTRVRKNPVGQFKIVALDRARDRKFYYSVSRGSFADGAEGRERATRFKSKALAGRIARGLLNKLPAPLRAPLYLET
jgi:hypothetical protein